MHAHREWKHFYYEPKTIRCAYETGSPHEKDVNAEISLPQFSAANVPKVLDSLFFFRLLDDYFYQALCL